eukprot:UN05825
MEIILSLYEIRLVRKGLKVFY